ncbi:hypothetical protein Bca4012_057282 [Brassica carinata]
MAENMVNLTKNSSPESTGVILLIDHDAVSVASLIPMLKQRSHKVISTEINIKEASDLLTKRACFCLKKPISENDINNMLQHVVAPNKRQELEKIKIAEKQEESLKQIQAFRDHIRRQGTSQSSLLGRRPLNKTFTPYEMYLKGKSIANVERCTNVWTRDRHMKFLAAISILGEKKSRPKAILEIMNDSNLSQRQVASHLQKYKFQVERISNTLTRNEWKSTTDKTFEYPSDYVYPFKASNLTKNFIEYFSLRKKKASSSSTVQYSFKRAVAERKDKMPKFHQGETSNLHSHSLSATNYNPYNNIPSTNDASNSGLSSHISHALSGSSVSASNLDAFQKESAEICINPNPCQASSYVLETNKNPLDMNQMGENHGLSQDMIFSGNESNHLGLDSGETSHIETPLETDTNQMDWDWFFSDEAYAILEDMTVSETNRTQVGLVPGETSSAALENVAPPENNTNEIGLVPYQEGDDIPIEDLISFDTDPISEMYLDAWLENYDASQRDAPLPASCIGHDLAFTLTDSIPHDHSLAMHLESTSQHQDIEAPYPREGGNHLDDDSDQNLDWLDDIFA